jgi:hypothetical protein
MGVSKGEIKLSNEELNHVKSNKIGNLTAERPEEYSSPLS